MSSLFALLSQQTPNLQTRKGLIVVGLQNDFISQDGKLPVQDTSFLDRVSKLVPAFREHGQVIFVRSEFQQTRPVNGDDTPGDNVVAGGSLGADTEMSSSRNAPRGDRKYLSSASFAKPDTGENDEELFLTKSSTREPACVRDTRGAEYAERLRPLMKSTDLHITTTHYSAFAGTALLLALRSKLITDVYICGCMTNLSVYATAMDAARFGIEITLVDDCLGYRRLDRHDMAIRQLSDLMDANTVSSSKLVERLHDPSVADDDSTDEILEQGGVLEVDSDEDSDEEVSLPSVGLSKQLLGRNAEREYSAPSSSYSRSAAERPRFASSQYAEPQSSPSQSWSTEQTSETRDRHGSRQKYAEAKVNAAPSRSRLNCRDSSEHSGQPWLKVIPPNYKPPHSFPLQPTYQDSSLAEPSEVAKSDLRKWEERTDELRRAQNMAANLAKSKPLFGEDKREESAGSRILYNLLPADAAESVFEDLQLELNWQSMFHQTGQVPRLVCCQATIGADGSTPLYRHPSDQTLPVEDWTSTVNTIRKAAENVARHSLNHALIQLYRDGNDFISEHSDKTLDIVPESNIVNVSFGAQRTMRIRTKRGPTKESSTTSTARTTYRVPTPHNSMITMSLRTNAEYLHAINWDRRPACELVEAEKAYAGQRISLTFRNIGTFLNKESTMIWGQGAVGKCHDAARPVVNANPEESEKLIQAFGKENAASSINWHDIYGAGSDVLHLK
ncbi:putative alkylated DNA repair protein alkB 3 [Septoria linicola]|nr:putative alkylated DNA repair protein alkB 3 [Septoria linicola]